MARICCRSFIRAGVLILCLMGSSCALVINDKLSLGQISGSSGTVSWKCDLAAESLRISGTATTSFPFSEDMLSGFPVDQISYIGIGSGITALGPGSFKGFSHVSELEIPYTVTYIGSDAFSGWSSKQKIILGWISTDSTSRTLTGLSSNCPAEVYYQDNTRF
jgi:hypothetical protein